MKSGSWSLAHEVWFMKSGSWSLAHEVWPCDTNTTKANKTRFPYRVNSQNVTLANHNLTPHVCAVITWSNGLALCETTNFGNRNKFAYFSKSDSKQALKRRRKNTCISEQNYQTGKQRKKQLLDHLYFLFPFSETLYRCSSIFDTLSGCSSVSDTLSGCWWWTQTICGQYMILWTS